MKKNENEKNRGKEEGERDSNITLSKSISVKLPWTKMKIWWCHRMFRFQIHAMKYESQLPF